MMGNEKYADYVPDKISPNSLSREFLLSVNKQLYNLLVDSIFGSNVVSKSPEYRKNPTVTIKY